MYSFIMLFERKMPKAEFVPYADYTEYSESEMIQRSKEFYEFLKKRRTVREYSDRKIPREVIENCLLAAGTAPNGANLQPWQFVVIEDASVKKLRRNGLMHLNI